MLDYRLLEAFAAILTEGGFEKAGQALGLTQSAVSQRLRLLEEQAGTILVIRENPPRASKAGERLLRHFEQTRSLEKAAVEESFADSAPWNAGAHGQINTQLGKSQGFVRIAIGVNADSLATWFLEATLPFWQSRPALFDLRVDDQERTLGMLKSGAVCACLSSHAKGITGCSVCRLGVMEYRLCASPSFAEQWFSRGYTLDAAALAPIIHYNREDGLQRDALRRCFGENAPDPPSYYLPSTERIYSMVTQGMGYCMIPKVQAADALKRGSLVELDPKARAFLNLYWHRWAVAPAWLEELSTELGTVAHLYLDP